MPVIKLNYLNTPTKDSWVSIELPNNNYGTVTSMAAGDGAESLIMFELGLIPNNAIINSARMGIRSSNATGELKIFVNTSDWEEGRVTYDNKPSREVTSITDTLVSGDQTIDLTELVQRWVNGLDNYGVTITKAGANAAIYTKEHATVAFRPYLEIDYSIPTEGKKQVEKIGVTKASTQSASIKLAMPTGVVIGDMLVAKIIKNTVATTFSAPDGWTFITPTENAVTVIAYKTYDGVGTDVTFTASVSTYISVVLSAYRNVKNVSLIGSTGLISGSAPSTNISSVPINSLLVAIFGITAVGSTANSVSLNFIIDDKIASGATGSNGISVASTYNHQKTSYSSSELFANMSGSGNNYITTLAIIPITNEAPKIDGQDESLGAKSNTFSYAYTVTDSDGTIANIMEKLNGEVVSSIDNPSELSRGFTVTKEQLKTLSYFKTHTIEIIATDDLGASTTRTLTFTRGTELLPPDTPLLDVVESVAELVPFINDGKNAIGDAINGVDGNVVIPADPTFNDLASGIRSIEPGGKKASGQVTSSIANVSIETNSGAFQNTPVIDIDTSILGFIPKYILIFTGARNVLTHSLWDFDNIFDGAGYANAAKGSSYYRVPYLGGVLTIPVYALSTNYYWIAYE